MPISPSDHTILTTTKANLDVRLERFGLYIAYPLAAHYSKIDGEVQKETSLKILDHIQRLGFAEVAKLKQENLEVPEVNLGENVVDFRRAKGG